MCLTIALREIKGDFGFKQRTSVMPEKSCMVLYHLWVWVRSLRSNALCL